MRLPEFSVKQPVAALMLFLAIIIIGGVSLTRLNIDMFPDIEPPVVSILTTWPGASASDVETEVTQSIENQVNGVNNLDTLTSKSLDNLSVVMCKFDWGTKLDVATNDIRDRLELAKRDLPRDIEPPMLFKFSSATAPIMFMTISGEKSWPRLFYMTDKQISDELRRVSGVGEVMIYGGLRRRINVYFDLKKIEGFHLSLQQVNQVLAKENLSIPAGSIRSGLKEYFVRFPARYKTVEEIKDTVVAYYQNRPVYLRDVAQVMDAYKPEDINGWGDGKKALVLILQKQTGKNTVAVIKQVKKKLEEIKENLPSDVKINIVMDNSENILRSIENLRDTLFKAIFFVILVTLIFLRRFRTAAIVALTIPFSLTISFILIYLAGYTINVVSLMSLAIASGMVVDNGIVVLENIIRHIEQRGRPKTSANFGASEMGMAITASTMTTVVVFVPLMFMTGIAGILFKQLGFVIVVTLLASLFTALTMTPMLASRWVTYTPASLKERKGFLDKLYSVTEGWFEVIEVAYGRILNWALVHRKTVLMLAAAIFLSSISLVPFLSTSFMPKVDSGVVDITFRLPEGTRIEETNKVVEMILKVMDDIVKPEEFRHSYAFDGQSEEGIGVALGFDEGPNVGEIGFKLVDRDKRERSARDIANILREKIKSIPGIDRLKVMATDPIGSILVGSGKPVNIEIQGTDIDSCLAFAERLEVAMKKVPGLVDIAISQKTPRPELWLEIDREKASSLGLNIAMIAGTLRNYLYGVEATQFRDGGDSYDMFTRFRREDKDRLSTLVDVPIFTPDGRMVKLSNIGRVIEGEGPIEIERKNRQKIIRVGADTYKRSLGEVTGDIRNILTKIGTPEGITVSLGGEVEEQKEAFNDLRLLLILGIILVYMVMAALYGNLRDPLIIMFSVPFAFSGILYAFYLTDTTLGIISFMGVIMLMGIVVNNAIVLLDYIHLLQKRGNPLFEAITLAGKTRLRPVLMTTLTTFFAMVPMAISKDMGAEIWNPLGITMLGGLSVSALVTLVLIPTIYYMFEKRKEGTAHRGQGSITK
ncbi:MAG: efflux RND transporter permease subunit [Thermodesulfobacteriota bacterium]|nr:efflux RND transporter permease subunit [Thermodesulfobacteriota bacterium]